MAVVGSFGGITFEVSADRLYLISGASRKSEAKVEEHEVVGGKPRLEFMAPKLDAIDFEIFLHAGHGVDPMTEIEKLRAMARQGEVQRLILGGRNYGRYLLVTVDEDWRRSLGDGRIIVASVKVSFKEYQ
jgi:phage protein U